MNTQSIVTACVILGNSLEESKLIDDEWNPVKIKDITYEDSEVITLFKRVYDVVDALDASEQSEYSKAATLAIESLPESERHGNMILIACNLLILAVTDSSGPTAKLIEMKATRIIDTIHRKVKEEAGAETVKHSFAVADNIHRFHTGRPILHDDLRELVKKKWVKNNEK